MAKKDLRKNRKFIINELYSILNEFTKPEFDIEQNIHEKICEFNNKKFRDKNLPVDADCLYEQIAFAFIETGTLILEWGQTFYKPLYGNIDSINKKWTTSYPDINDINFETIDYWERRSSEVDNPILKCRYSGLVWDFSKKARNIKPDISVAHRVIDSTIQIANLGGDRFFHKLERALRLAVSLNAKQKITSIREAIIKNEDTYSEDNKPGTWGYAYDLLIGDKKLPAKVQLKKEQEDKIIDELERKLKIFSDKKSNTFNPHSVEYVVEKLVPYYKDKQDRKNIERVLIIYRDSFLYGIKNNLVMVGSRWLEKIRKVLFQYGFSEEAKQLEPYIRSLQQEDLTNLKKIETSFKVPQKEIDNYISELDKRDLFQGLNYIALSYIPNKKSAQDTVLKTAKEYPLHKMVATSIMDYTGREVDTVDSLDKDLEGHTVLEMSRLMYIYVSLIGLGLNHLKENKSLNANSMAEHLFKSQVFPKERHAIIKEGLTAYFNKNYIVSCSVLIHQIESAIRGLIVSGGGAIYQPSSNFKDKGFKLRPLGSLLEDKVFKKVFEKLDSNIPFFLKTLLVDQRSLNIRNSICHGHFSAHFLNEVIATHIIHILLILSFIRKTTHSSNK